MRIYWVALTLALTGCARAFVPPRPTQPVSPAAVAASYDKTWESIVSYFAERNIPIRTIEKASGIVVAEPLRSELQNRVPVLDAKGKVIKNRTSEPVYADCGHYPGGPEKGGFSPVKVAVLYDPTTVIYNIRLLGDATTSTVQVNMRFASDDVACSSTGKLESEIQSFIKTRAEAK